MQKFLASIAALSAVAALSGCAIDPAAKSELMVEKEYATGSRLPQRQGSKVQKSKMSDEDRADWQRLSETMPEPSK